MIIPGIWKEVMPFPHVDVTMLVKWSKPNARISITCNRGFGETRDNSVSFTGRFWQSILNQKLHHCL